MDVILNKANLSAMHLSRTIHSIPIRILEATETAQVEWIDNGPIASPLFEEAAADLRRQLAAVGESSRWTDLDALASFSADLTPCLPTALIFHTSRCGSTLLTRMLATLGESSVIAESVIVDQLLNSSRATIHNENTRIARLRGFALAHARAARPGRFWIKFDCHHIFHLGLIRRAFPGVPWLFLYRDPVEVLVSHKRQRGLPMIPTETEMCAWPDYGNRPMLELLDDHSAKMIGRICHAAADGHQSGESLFLNHRDLSTRLKTEILPFLQVSADTSELETIMQCLHENAKHPGQSFLPDSTSKRAEASPLIRQAAAQWARSAYERVEAVATRPVSGFSRETAFAPATERA